MVSFEDFKKSLGKVAEGLSEQKIRELNALAAALARATLDDYFRPKEAVTVGTLAEVKAS